MNLKKKQNKAVAAALNSPLSRKRPAAMPGLEQNKYAALSEAVTPWRLKQSAGSVKSSKTERIKKLEVSCMEEEKTIIRIRRGINGFKYSVCDKNGYFIGNCEKLADVRKHWLEEIKFG